MAASPQIGTLVVGGGSAGCVVAGRLAAAGERVALVEAGPDYGAWLEGRWPDDLLDGRMDAMASHGWGFPGGVAATRARVIGGCSAINGCGILAGLREDYDAWHDRAPGWNDQALRPFVERAERTIRSRVSRCDDLDPWRRAFVGAAHDIGLANVDRFDDGTAEDAVGPIATNTLGTLRWNAAFAYLDPVRAAGQLTILPGLLADRVVVAGGRARGVVLRGAMGARTVTARRIVLAAGTYGTPAILIRSGVGPVDDLERLGIPLVRDRPGVGWGLRDHPLVDVPLDATNALGDSCEAYAREDRAVAQALIRASHRGSPWELQLGPWSTDALTPDGRRIPSGYCGITVTLTQPRSTGRVIVTSRDPSVLPTVDHGFLTDAGRRDEDAMLAGVDLARRLSVTRSIADVATPRPADAFSDDEARRRGWIREAVSGNFHPVGTCRMGPAAARLAVVDDTGRVHGVAGLHVVDASIFPAIPRANTHLTVLAVAERLSELLASEVSTT